MTMSPETVVEAVALLINLVFLAALALLWDAVRLRLFRDSLFTIRDRLFDRMLETGCSFDSDAYRLMRASLNGSIRSAAQLRPLTVLFAFPKTRGLEWANPESFAQTTTEHQIIAEARYAYRAVVARHFFFLHLTGWVVALWIVLYLRFHRRNSKSLVESRPIDAFEIESVKIGRVADEYPDAIEGPRNRAKALELVAG